MQVILSVLAYSFCSGTLVLINKVLLHLLPFPSLVVVVQLWFAVLFIYGARCCKLLEVDPIKWEYVVPYLYYMVLFSGGVYCNMKSLQYSNVETVIVFRALAPAIVSVLDSMFLGREIPSLRSWFALSLIVAGALGYSWEDPQFQSQGLAAYFWPFLYLFVISLEMAYGKKVVKSVPLKTLSGPVLYTNLLGWPAMLGFAYFGGEYESFWEQLWVMDNARFPPGAVPLLLLGCAVGTGIGYSGWWCRSMVSATSFTLIGVMNKCLTILVNCLIWDQHANAKGIASLFLCLVGGSLYRQAPMRGGEKDLTAAEMKETTEGTSPTKTSTYTSPTITVTEKDPEIGKPLLDAQEKQNSS